MRLPNGDEVTAPAPVWGLDIKCAKGTNLSYGPWADRQREQLFRFFFPQDYQTLKVGGCGGWEWMRCWNLVAGKWEMEQRSDCNGHLQWMCGCMMPVGIICLKFYVWWMFCISLNTKTRFTLIYLFLLLIILIIFICWKQLYTHALSFSHSFPVHLCQGTCESSSSLT